MAAKHPLDGARLKVAWARDQLGALKQQIRAYLDTEPYGVQPNAYPNGDGLVIMRNPPPLPISAQAGVCVGSLMAALDYVIWELAGRYVGRPMVHPPHGTDKPSFPLFFEPGRYRANVGRLSRYKIPAEAMSVIESAQPYNAGHESLGWLYNLANGDKHRLPLLTIAHARKPITITKRRTPLPISDGDRVTIAFFRPEDFVEPSSAEVDHQAAIFIALKESGVPPQPVDKTIAQILETVASLIPRFDAFFT
jgi:hypothetical protein